ncbi:MAG: hypothetical protein ABI779_16395, partial [Acidobacteriota bacterium]
GGGNQTFWNAGLSRRRSRDGLSRPRQSKALTSRHFAAFCFCGENDLHKVPHKVRILEGRKTH